MKTKYVTKPGKHGTLYLYRYEYRDPIDSGFPKTKSATYAYSREHVEDKFAEEASTDGFEIVPDSIHRVKA